MTNKLNWNQRRFIAEGREKNNAEYFTEENLTTAQIADINRKCYDIFINYLFEAMPDPCGGVGIETRYSIRDDFYKPENMRRH